MGSTDSIAESSLLRLNNNNWRAMRGEDQQQQPIQYGRYVRLKNQMTAQEINQYQLVFSDSDHYQQFVHALNFRNSVEHLVHIRYFNEQKIHHLCSLLVNLHLYIDHFPLRISQLTNIPHPQNLYVLARALTGFSILYHEFGHFHITQDLICVNQQGIIKIWLNPNLSKSHAQPLSTSTHQQNISNHHRNTQNSMIWQLLTIVERLTNRQTLPNRLSFIDYLSKINKPQLNFDQAQRHLALYAREMECQIPEVFESALKIMRQKRGIFDSEVDITQGKVKVEEIDLTNLGSRFKQSKVQRIQSIKNHSLKSEIASESNHTFADKLKSFDRARAKMDMLGKSNLTPIKENIVTIPEKNEPLTERVLGNPLTFSYVSSPQFQSLTAIGQKHKAGAFPTSSSNSQIISKNPLTLSESPVKQKPQTYFSQYINPNQQIKMAKKATLFSFGGAHQEFGLTETKHKENLLNEGPVTISLENSKNQVKPTNKPTVTFTYHPNLGRKSSFFSFPEPETQPKFPIMPLSAKFLEKAQDLDQMDMPISPPSVDKKSSMFLEQAKQIEQNEKQAQGKIKQNMIETMMRRQNKQICQSFYTKAMQNHLQNQDKGKQEEEVHLSDSPLYLGKIEQSRDKPQNYPLIQSKQPLTPTNAQDQLAMILENLGTANQPTLTQVQKPITSVQLYAANPQTGNSQQILTTILLNEFEIDPDIMCDLLQYQQHRIHKKKSKNSNNL